MLEKLGKYFRSLEKDAIPQLSINCVIFGFHEKTLKVIVNEIRLGKAPIIVLPGGYVGQKEDVTQAVERIVRESTGLERILFKQFAVFGDATRSFSHEHLLNGDLKELDKKVLRWLTKRFVSICYLALVDYNKIDLRPTQFLDAAQWLAVDKAKTLALDHSEIVKSARETLLRELPYSPIASNLLPSRFTLPQLLALVEEILGRSIDRPNFRRKILKSGLLVKVGQDATGNRRPADLYTFKYGKKTYLAEEFKFGF